MSSEPAETKRRGESPYHSRAVSRALNILKSFTVDDFELSIADLHDRLGIPKSTLVRLLLCMADEGFIEHNEQTSKYRLGVKLFELGSLYERTRVMNVRMLARPHMQELVDRYRLSSNLAIRDSAEIVYIGVAEPVGTQMRIAYSVGDRFGLHHTALGKALLAFMGEGERDALLEKIDMEPLTPNTIDSVEKLKEELARVRERGYAVDDQESLPGLRCVAAPIRSLDGVMAAMSVSGSILEIADEREEQITADVMDCAKRISVKLGARPQA